MRQISALLPVKDAAIYAESIIYDLKVNCDDGDEILIIDDFSTDGTFELFTELIKDDPRFKIIRNINPGLANALNLGISISEHEWIARFDSDDRYESDRISVQRKLLAADVSCIFTDYSLHDEHFNPIAQIPSPIFDSCVKLSLVKNARTPHPSVIFSKSKAVLAGGYSSSEFPAEDLGLWLRMSEFGCLISAPRDLLHYTVRRNSISSTKQGEMVVMRESLIKNSKVLMNSFQDVQLKWREYFKEYDLLTNATERKFLTTIEYCQVGQIFNFKYKLTCLKMLLGILMQRDWLLPVLRLVKGKLKLNLARKLET